MSEPKPRRKIFPIVILLVLAAAGFTLWRVIAARNQVPDNVITLSGRIEGDDSAVAPKTAGRIIEIRVREGDRVKAGDDLAVLDDLQIRAR